MKRNLVLECVLEEHWARWNEWLSSAKSELFQNSEYNPTPTACNKFSCITYFSTLTWSVSSPSVSLYLKSSFMLLEILQQHSGTRDHSNSTLLDCKPKFAVSAVFDYSLTADIIVVHVVWSLLKETIKCCEHSFLSVRVSIHQQKQLWFQFSSRQYFLYYPYGRFTSLTSNLFPMNL